MAVKARGEITLTQVDDGILVSATAPEAPYIGQLWQQESGQPIKRWDGSKWTIHYISVDNLNAQILSAITANLGTVTAGKILSAAVEKLNFSIDLDTGEIKSYNDEDTSSLLIKSGYVEVAGDDPETNYVKLRLSAESGLRSEVSNKSVSFYPVIDQGSGRLDYALKPGEEDAINIYSTIDELNRKLNLKKWKKIAAHAATSYIRTSLTINDYDFFIIQSTDASGSRVLASIIIFVDQISYGSNYASEVIYPSEPNNYKAHCYFDNSGFIYTKSSSQWDAVVVYGIKR